MKLHEISAMRRHIVEVMGYFFGVDKQNGSDHIGLDRMNWNIPLVLLVLSPLFFS